MFDPVLLCRLRLLLPALLLGEESRKVDGDVASWRFPAAAAQATRRKQPTVSVNSLRLIIYKQRIKTNLS